MAVDLSFRAESRSGSSVWSRAHGVRSWVLIGLFAWLAVSDVVLTVLFEVGVVLVVSATLAGLLTWVTHTFGATLIRTLIRV